MAGAPDPEQQQPATEAEPQPAAAERGGLRAVGRKSQDNTRSGLKKCAFHIAKKGRNCNFAASPGSDFCGNHQPTGAGPRRVSCPWDPNGSHTVAEGELERHKLVCPSYLQAVAEQGRPFVREGANAGPPAAEVALPPAPPHLADSRGRVDSLAVRRLAAAVAMGEADFRGLLARIDAAHAQTCGGEERVSVAEPPPAHASAPAPGDSQRPVSAKHAAQQASIVGNMAGAGLLAGAAGTTYIEFGAGKGYLSAMLADCSAASSIVLLDSGRFRLKADRSLRHLRMQRLCCDIKDFVPAGVGALSGRGGGAAPWVATGKHLCGAATDFTLRACCATPGTAASKQGQQQQQQADADGGGAAGPAPGLRGLAIATCCHHRCTWRHYAGKAFFRRLGLSPLDFELLSWMTGWALCGHEAAAGTEGGGSGDEEASGSDSGRPAEDRKAEAPRQDWHPARGLSRSFRIGVGQKCKRLIDAGRLEWLQRRGFAAEALLYVPPQVSGENRLLLATAPGGKGGGAGG